MRPRKTCVEILASGNNQLQLYGHFQTTLFRMQLFTLEFTLEEVKIREDTSYMSLRNYKTTVPRSRTKRYLKQCNFIWSRFGSNFSVINLNKIILYIIIDYFSVYYIYFLCFNILLVLLMHIFDKLLQLVNICSNLHGSAAITIF